MGRMKLTKTKIQGEVDDAMRRRVGKLPTTHRMTHGLATGIPVDCSMHRNFPSKSSEKWREQVNFRMNFLSTVTEWRETAMKTCSPSRKHLDRQLWHRIIGENKEKSFIQTKQARHSYKPYEPRFVNLEYLDLERLWTLRFLFRTKSVAIMAILSV